MLSPRILTVGDVTIECFLKTSHLPTPGTTAVGDEVSYSPGGRGAKTAVALARMGGDTLLCTRVGNDTNGEELSQYLYAEGVDTRFMLSTDGETTGLTIHLCEYNVAERRMIFGGAGAFLSAKDVEDAFMSYPDAVILQGDIPTSALAEASRAAKMRELPLFLLSLPQDYDGGKLPVDCEILSVDDEQILRHTGIRPSDQTGLHDENSVENVRWLQRRAGLNPTGIMDQPTWNALSRLYETFVIPEGVLPDEMFPTWG
jgi:ribokinase